VAALLGAPRAIDAQQTATEESVTAAFLLNFARFTQWPVEPRSASSPMLLCVADPGVADELDEAARGRMIHQRRIEVRRVSPDETLSSCDVLFVGRTDSAKLTQLLASLEGTSVLTVSDADSFAEQGGVIGLYVEDGRMRFAINLRAAKAAGLGLSAQLLNLARVIR
jgi:hypothetical protein